MMPQEGIPPQQEAVPGGFGSVAQQGQVEEMPFQPPGYEPEGW
jgi:hypothetical protein